ncbi:MAG: M23 family metallopeptidase [Kiloniellales bacterium]
MTLPRVCLLLTLSLAALGAARAADSALSLSGARTQGGLLLGETLPGAEVFLDQKPVAVSPEGRFLVGFGREAAPMATLRVLLPDGREFLEPLEIARRDYQIQRIDGLPQSMVTPPEEVLKRIADDNAKVAAARAVALTETLYASGFVWPALGPVSGVYGSQRILNGEPRQPHYGVDVAAPRGTPVVAPADGLVTLAERDLYYTGGTIILDHGYRLSSTLMHLDSVTVAVGQRVEQGEQVGTLGATGRATGPHLDWRMNWFEERIDPALLAGPMPESGTN